VKIVYIVMRDAEMFGNYDIDVFEDEELAEEWAKHIGSEVVEEGIINRDMLDALKLATPGRLRGDDEGAP
jgi:hypothetical protein